MKKIISLVVVALIIASTLVSFASCGAKSIVGEWETEINFGKMMASGEGAEEFAGLVDSLKDKSFKFSINFKDNGKATASVDTESYVAIMKELFGGLATEEDLESGLEDQMGEEVDYKFENGELTLGDAKYKAELSGNKLIFKEVISASEEENNQMLSAGMLPLEFKRK